jgi:nicotinate-nucleotide adenylyltransferase
LKICLFGGAFDPIHISHVLAIHYVAATGGFDKVFVIPTYSSPAGKKLIDFNYRLNMCSIACGFIPNVIVSGVEEQLSTPSFTINTVRKYKEFYPEAELRLAIGADILSSTHLWKPEDLKEIFEMAPPFILGRFGYEHPDANGPIIPGVSSTKVRELIKTDNHTELSKIVPTSVLKYIEENRLYI